MNKYLSSVFLAVKEKNKKELQLALYSTVIARLGDNNSTFNGPSEC